MKLSDQLAKHFKEVFFGGNWTAVNLKETLENITWQQATQKVYTFNTIATLVYHINYYVNAATTVFNGEPLNAHDTLSFNTPEVSSAEGWQNLLKKTFNEAEKFALKIAQLPENKLSDIFAQEKYGNYLRNIMGITEHVHYHLGQIVLIKKMINQTP